MRKRVHFTPGDGMGWALDEDLRQTRVSLDGLVRACPAAAAEIVHAVFWQNLPMVDERLLDRSFVIAHADNPPFFYVRQPEFAAGQQAVDLWIARSREAYEQFRRLGLAAEWIPYTIDPALFHPLEDRAAIRREFGLPESAYVIANFHRDTEGSDLVTPKTQKAPEMLVEILREVQERGAPMHVLLAGPRRHWIRSRLEALGIPYTFVGRPDVPGDDCAVNILSREALNRLYNAADLYVIPSRWEGGPQSAMEAAACRCKVLSIPLGVARDVLEPDALFRTVPEAVEAILADRTSGRLDRTVGPQFERLRASHTTAKMAEGLRALYARLEEMPAFRAKAGRGRLAFPVACAAQVRHEIRRRFRRPRLPGAVSWNHRSGICPVLDRWMDRVRETLDRKKIAVVEETAEVEWIGLPQREPGGTKRYQLLVSGSGAEEVSAGALLLVPAVAELVALRQRGVKNPALVCPFPGEASGGISDEPFVFERKDPLASVGVWEALGAGRPVVYPADAAVFSQVFHAGIPYEGEDRKEAAISLARRSAETLRRLAWRPSERDLEQFLMLLLRK